MVSPGFVNLCLSASPLPPSAPVPDLLQNPWTRQRPRVRVHSSAAAHLLLHFPSKSPTNMSLPTSRGRPRSKCRDRFISNRFHFISISFRVGDQTFETGVQQQPFAVGFSLGPSFCLNEKQRIGNVVFECVSWQSISRGTSKFGLSIGKLDLRGAQVANKSAKEACCLGSSTPVACPRLSAGAG